MVSQARSTVLNTSSALPGRLSKGSWSCEQLIKGLLEPFATLPYGSRMCSIYRLCVVSAEISCLWAGFVLDVVCVKKELPFYMDWELECSAVETTSDNL